MKDDDVLKTDKVLVQTEFGLEPDAERRSAWASELGLKSLKKLRFMGTISPDRGSDLVLQAQLGATVVQECVVTGAPVTTRIEESVLRRFVKDLPEPTGEESEMPEDDSLEPLGETVDLAAVMIEALALALPPWPRAEGVEPIDITVTEPGLAPLRDEDTKPFAGLKSLRDKLAGDDQ